MQFNFKFTYEQSLHVDINVVLKNINTWKGLVLKCSFTVEFWFPRKEYLYQT